MNSYKSVNEKLKSIFGHPVDFFHVNLCIAIKHRYVSKEGLDLCNNFVPVGSYDSCYPGFMDTSVCTIGRKFP